mgnify:CR=1 FL=1
MRQDNGEKSKHSQFERRVERGVVIILTPYGGKKKTTNQLMNKGIRRPPFKNRQVKDDKKTARINRKQSILGYF